jgi:hypothetical protein
VFEVIVLIQFDLDEFVTIIRVIGSKDSNFVLTLISVASSIDSTGSIIYFEIDLDFLFHFVWLLIVINCYLSFFGIFRIFVDIEDEFHVCGVTK